MENARQRGGPIQALDHDSNPTWVHESMLLLVTIGVLITSAAKLENDMVKNSVEARVLVRLDVPFRTFCCAGESGD